MSLDELKPLLLEQWQITNQAQERLWHAETRVDELKAQLAAAEGALERARLAHERHGVLLTEVWQLVRGELMNLPIAEDT